uniref:Uncharacterized protein n=1 Tax=Takifugu rubripes TaxID=31033 RepID=A0A674MZB6_TAKRU
MSTFLDNDQVQNTEIGINDAAADRLALALASPAGTVAGVSLAKQQTHATVGQHTLLHGKTLLVVASADAHHVSLDKRKVLRSSSTSMSFWQPVAGNEMFS